MAISLTSGVAKSAEDEVRKAVEVVKALRARYDLPIGVPVYPTETSSEELYSAGATEIQYNVETMDPELFIRERFVHQVWCGPARKDGGHTDLKAHFAAPASCWRSHST
jgi:sulfur carrier protein ThiS